MTNTERISQGIETAEHAGQSLHSIDPGSLDLMLRGYFDMLARIIWKTRTGTRLSVGCAMWRWSTATECSV